METYASAEIYSSNGKSMHFPDNNKIEGKYNSWPKCHREWDNMLNAPTNVQHFTQFPKLLISDISLETSKHCSIYFQGHPIECSWQESLVKWPICTTHFMSMEFYWKIIKLISTQHKNTQFCQYLSIAWFFTYSLIFHNFNCNLLVIFLQIV